MNRSSFLYALQLGDSALPTGRFSHSHGLEEILRGDETITDSGVAEIVEAIVLEVVAPLDGVAVAEAHRLAAARDASGLRALDRAVTIRKITPSSRYASTACGRRLAVLASVVTGDLTMTDLAEHIEARRSDGNLAVVEGTLSHALDITLEEAVLLELRGTSAALLSAALRLGRISATQAQLVAASLVPALSEGVDIALALTTESMRAVAPELDVAAIRHKTRDARVFAT